MIPIPPTAYLRAAGLAVAVLAVLGLGLLVNHWRVKASQVDAVKAEAAQQVAQARQAIETMKAQQRASDEAAKGYLNELEEIRNRPAVRRVVRVCVESNVPADSGSAPRPHGAGETAPLVSAGTGQGISRDIGADLVGLMVEGDRCSAQLRSLQDWIIATR